MKLLVCGGRDFIDVPLLWRTLDELRDNTPEPGIRLVIDGASDDVTGPYKGADYWAHQWALARNIPTVRVHAKWQEQGRSAGPRRNGEMIEAHRPDRLVAFYGGRGTANMIEQASRAGNRFSDCSVIPDYRGVDMTGSGADDYPSLTLSPSAIRAMDPQGLETMAFELLAARAENAKLRAASPLVASTLPMK